MPTEPTPSRDEPPAEQEPTIPRPPSPEALDQISEEQAMITDEWSGDAPAKSPEPQR
ncbi:hypothetical protein [Roseomonas sp. BN140053]|uniref:hypothetical protein n=1 Tax=Roseomonas sp. BN140053 TaxID=3391898 RepID=UPI0039E7546C